MISSSAFSGFSRADRKRERDREGLVRIECTGVYLLAHFERDFLSIPLGSLHHLTLMFLPNPFLVCVVLVLLEGLGVVVGR